MNTLTVIDLEDGQRASFTSLQIYIRDIQQIHKSLHPHHCDLIGEMLNTDPLLRPGCEKTLSMIDLTRTHNTGVEDGEGVRQSGEITTTIYQFNILPFCEFITCTF